MTAISSQICESCIHSIPRKLYSNPWIKCIFDQFSTKKYTANHLKLKIWTFPWLIVKRLNQKVPKHSRNQNSHGYSKPEQPFHHNKANSHTKPSFKPTYRPHDNKGQHFKDNSKYQKQTAHTNAIEDYESQQEDLISFEPSEDQTKN